MVCELRSKRAAPDWDASLISDNAATALATTYNINTINWISILKDKAGLSYSAMKFPFRNHTHGPAAFACWEESIMHNQGANSTLSRSKMLNILDILLHKFQLV